jgi:hypothetical protein
MMKWITRILKTPQQVAATTVYCAVQPGIEAGQYYDNVEVYDADYLGKLGKGVNKEERLKLYKYTEDFLAKYGAT